MTNRSIPSLPTAWLRTLASTLGPITAALVLISSSVSAKGADPCPEPNDGYQHACSLAPGSADGFLSRADDLDMYRVDALDWDATLAASFAEMPYAYRLTLFDWNGTPLATSNGDGGTEGLQAKLGPPGSYFLAVDSRTGEFSDDAPYRLSVGVEYAAASVPRITASTEFAQDDGEERAFERVTVTRDGGSLLIATTRPGTAERELSGLLLGPATLEDFTFVTDSRMIDGPPAPTPAGYVVAIRRSVRRTAAIKAGSGFIPTGYVLQVDVNNSTAKLRRVGEPRDDVVLDTFPVPSVTRDRVNRTIVRFVGDELSISFNGDEPVRVKDGGVRSGRQGIGAVTWGAPNSVRFDNVMVTTPGSK